jgi:hypothetical protein
VEEAGHCGKNCTPGEWRLAKKNKTFETQRNRGSGGREIANNAEIAKKPD